METGFQFVTASSRSYGSLKGVACECGIEGICESGPATVLWEKGEWTERDQVWRNHLNIGAEPAIWNMHAIPFGDNALPRGTRPHELV